MTIDQTQGILTSETRCLNCETVTSKDEEFCDLSIDVDQNTSVTSCLRSLIFLILTNFVTTFSIRNFSSTETLCSDNKFKCDTCSSYQVLTMLSLLSIDEVGQVDDNQNDQNDPDPYFYL